jgi:hypothetical protein
MNLMENMMIKNLMRDENIKMILYYHRINFVQLIFYYFQVLNEEIIELHPLE